MSPQRSCSVCGLVFPESHFVRRSSRCRECRVLYRREHYLMNSDYYKEKARRNKKGAIEVNKEWLLDYLLAHPCVDCGESDPVVLEFDHRDPSSKVAAVSVLARNGYSLKAVQNEVAACDVRCANCHRRRTHEQRRWWGRARHDSNVQPSDP